MINKTHSRRELEILEKTTPDAIVIPFKKEIISLCKAFGKSGQSGGSAPFTARAISMAVEKLMMHETLAPLTGEDDEWNDVTSINDGEPWYQNNRDSRVFKEGKQGKPYFIDAIVFDGNIGGRFTGGDVVTLKNGKKIGSLQYIKSFPFEPKTFYIDVIDKRWVDEEETRLDENGNWWTHEIKDEDQLKEVFEYYNVRCQES